MIFPAEAMVLSSFARDFDAFALVTENQQVLFAQAERAHETGLLLAGIETAQKYLKLTPNDVVLLHDPFMGGAGDDRMTFVTFWKTGGAGFYAAITASHPSWAKIKLPLAPVRLDGQLNEDVLKALEESRPQILALIKNLETHQKIFAKDAVQKFFAPSAIKSHLGLQKKYLDHFFDELPHGNASVESHAAGKPLTRLRVQSEGKHLSFDFTGTAPAGDWRLPMMAASGVIWQTVFETLGVLTPICTESLSRLELSLPQGCWLNAPTAGGAREMDKAAEWLRHILKSALIKWHKELAKTVSPQVDSQANYSFGGLASFAIGLRPSGALFDLGHQQGISIETLEKKHPVLFSKVQKTTADSKEGLALEITFLKAAQVTVIPGTSGIQTEADGKNLKLGQAHEIAAGTPLKIQSE